MRMVGARKALGRALAVMLAGDNEREQLMDSTALEPCRFEHPGK